MTFKRTTVTSALPYANVRCTSDTLPVYMFRPISMFATCASKAKMCFL